MALVKSDFAGDLCTDGFLTFNELVSNARSEERTTFVHVGGIGAVAGGAILVLITVKVIFAVLEIHMQQILTPSLDTLLMACKLLQASYTQWDSTAP